MVDLTQSFRNAKTWIAEQQAKGKTVKLLTVGKKHQAFIAVPR